MSKLDDKVADLVAYCKKHKIKGVDAKDLAKVAKAMGPSLYKADASKVACGQKSELATIAKNVCKKKFGLKDDKKIMDGIMDVCKQMGMSNRNKQRAVFYYLLAKRFRKMSVYK